MVAGAAFRVHASLLGVSFFVLVLIGMATPQEEFDDMKRTVETQSQQIQALLGELGASRREQVNMNAAIQSLQSAGQPSSSSVYVAPLVDTKLLSKPSPYAGETEGKEKWSVWSFKFKAYCSAMAPRMSELMEASETQTTEILNNSMAPKDVVQQHLVLCVELVD